MARPKSILWVDDEVESLAAHVLFLQEHGYEVEPTAHGDDALALLRRQSYGVVLLDEQMPGKRGLELLSEIRGIDPSVPVVMVTKSEEAGTMREAIGVEMDDYIVKPVNPRQVLSAVTRLLEGTQIRQQRMARDFVGRFRELENRRASQMGWREWVELVAELAQWEARLGEGEETGLREALGALQRGLHADFAEYIEVNYPKWLAEPDSDRPPLSVDVGQEFLVPLIKSEEKVLFVVADCMRLDQWELLKPLIAELFDIEVSYYYSIFPTATPFARNAIFSGLFPIEIAERHPDRWGERDGESLNAHEAQLLKEQLIDLTGEERPVHYDKISTDHEGIEMVKRLPSYLASPGVTALVFNFIDLLTHGRSDNAILHEVARDASALRNLTRTWFRRSSMFAALREAERRGVSVLLTTDHGSIHCQSPATVFAKRDATSNLRYKFGEDLRAEKSDAAIMVKDLPAWGLPAMGLGVRMLLATKDHVFVYPTKLREYQARYKGSFQHGGVTPEETIVPVALLTPRGAG
jgi:DNA-binding response OmpR family regulator